MSYGKRVYDLRKQLNLTLEKFGEPLGVTKTAISRIEKEERTITDQMAKAICREYGVNEEWLRTGKGDMFVPLNRTQQIAKLTTDLFKGEKDSFKERLLFALSKLDESDWKVLERIANDLIKEKD